jgi:hypothetical protein
MTYPNVPEPGPVPQGRVGDLAGGKSAARAVFGVLAGSAGGWRGHGDRVPERSRSGVGRVDDVAVTV